LGLSLKSRALSNMGDEGGKRNPTIPWQNQGRKKSATKSWVSVQMDTLTVEKKRRKKKLNYMHGQGATMKNGGHFRRERKEKKKGEL